MQFFERLEAVRERWNVLEHSFYQRWTRGELLRDELVFYAGEYRHAVVALADTVEATAQRVDPAARDELAQHAADEAAHVALWDEFVTALEGETERPALPETLECVDAWTSSRDALEGLVAMYAIESGQPAISQTKLDGLVEHYSMPEGPATEYFSLHAELDADHAAEARAMIEERIADEDSERLLAVAEHVFRGNWILLDGVERGFQARGGQGSET